MSKKVKTSNKAKVWLGFFIIASLISAIIGFLPIFFQLNAVVGLLAGIGTWLLIIIITLIRGYVETPHNHEDIVEFMGKFIGRPLKSGPHLLFPYFGLEVIRARVFMGQQKIELYLDEKASGGGDVEFKDCSSSLQSHFFFKIVNSVKATYGVSDVLDSIKEKAEHILRAFFGMFTLDQAIQLKSFFKLENVVKVLEISENSPAGGVEPELVRRITGDDSAVKISEEDLIIHVLRKVNIGTEEVRDTRFYTTLKSWGVEPVTFLISDIEIPEDIKKQRARILTADKDREVAKIDNLTAAEKAKKTVIEAKAEKSKSRIIGEGKAQALKAVVSQGGLPQEEIADYLVQTAKWESLGKNANVTIIEDGGGKVSDGTKIGVGIGAVVKKEKNETKKSKEDNK